MRHTLLVALLVAASSSSGCVREEIATGLTRTAFEAIPEGSTKEEVRRKLGAPFTEVVQVSSGRTSRSEQLHWCYGKRTSWTGVEYSFPMLTFVDGKVQSRAWDMAALDAQMSREMEEIRERNK
jgi:hypothetical protein